MKNGQSISSVAKRLVIIASLFVAETIISFPNNAAEVIRPQSLGDRVTQLESQQQARNQALVDVQFKLAKMQQELRNFRGTLEENGYKLGQVTERQREIYKDVDRRLAAAQKKLDTLLASGTGAVNPAANSRYSNSIPKTRVSRRPNTAIKAHASKAESDAYQRIFPLVRNKQYASAVTAYRKFLSVYPSGYYVVNAHYWLGQVNFVQGQLDQAAIQFAIIKDKYPKSSKAADAMLKLAVIHQQKHELDQARSLLKQIMHQFPESQAARMAERRLRELKLG